MGALELMIVALLSERKASSVGKSKSEGAKVGPSQKLGRANRLTHPARSAGRPNST